MSPSATASPSVSPTAVEPVLQLDPDSLILGDGDRLQLINRRGSFEMQGKSLHQLHQLFAPHLNGSHRESELVSAVAAHQASAVRSYLGTLRSFGAFVDAPPTEDLVDESELLPLDALSPSRPIGTFAVAGVPVHISLVEDPLVEDPLVEGPEPIDTPSIHSLYFVTPVQGLRRLTAWSQDAWGQDAAKLEKGGRQVLVLVPDPEFKGPASGAEAPGETELRRRAAVARWLLSGAADPGDGEERLQIFRLGAATAVESLASVNLQADPGEAGRIDEHGDGRIGLATLTDQLGWIASGDVEQLPLAVARGRLPFVDRANTGWVYGLHYEAVRQTVLDESFGTLMQEKDPSFFADTSPTQPVEPAEPAEPLLHARQRSHVLLRLAERHESRLGAESLQPVDLMTLAGDESVTCVQGMLRSHVDSLPAQLGTTPGGAFVLQCNGRRAVSFFPLKAQLEILLRLLFAAEHGALERASGEMGSMPAVQYDDYVTPTDAAQLVARYAGMPVRLRQSSLLGRSVWSGRLLDPTPSAPSHWTPNLENRS